MKNYDETINSVFDRINKYEIEKKRRRNIITKAVSLMCCFCLVALTVGVWHSGLLSSAPSDVQPGKSDGSSDTGEHVNSDLPETDAFTNDTEDSMGIVHIISLSQENIGEFAADMYRPEGFNKNIGSVLAIKMNMVSESGHMFPVIVNVDDKSSLEQTIKTANDILSEPINIADVKLVSVIEFGHTVNQYYILLTCDQITALADVGAGCYYVGSRKGNYQDISWDTEEGINTYCELFGDMYIISGDSDGIHYSPDLYVE